MKRLAITLSAVAFLTGFQAAEAASRHRLRPGTTRHRQARPWMFKPCVGQPAPVTVGTMIDGAYKFPSDYIKSRFNDGCIAEADLVMVLGV